MDTRDFFKNIYDDYFGIEKIKLQNEQMKEELGLNKNFPEIELNKEEKENLKVDEQMSPEELKEKRNNKMLDFFDKIEKLYITEKSKNTLKKIIEYMRKYNEKLEKEYIQFNMCIYSDSKETIYSIADIISDSAEFFNYIKQADSIECSFYNIEKIEQIEDIYNSKNNIILFKDFEGIISNDQNFKDRFWHKMEEKCDNEIDGFITILSAKNEDLVDTAFNGNEEIKNNLFDFKIDSVKPDVQDIYNEIINKLSENNDIEDDISIKILDYVSFTYPNSDLSYPDYIDKLCKKILFSKEEKIGLKDIPEYEKEKTMEEIFQELNELVGLENVKQVLQDLVSLIELKNKTKDELKIKDTNLHMVFLGNPGTGKTTVARLISQILYNLKYIKQNKLIEVSSKDLVAEYVGQTAPKTMKVIEKALGGVLFIDEAYSLASGNGEGNSFNEEAIATLIQAMENYRDNLVVIFAGYTKEMQDFLNANSGIVSRIGYTLDFKDYTEEELLEIFKSMVIKAGFEIEKDAEEKVLEVINEYKNTKNFGNARFVRSLYEKTVIKHASNTKNKKQKKILKTITKIDISTENLLKM